jgi:hypothetical protein
MRELLNSVILVRKTIEQREADSITTAGFLKLTNANLEYVNLLFDQELIEVLDTNKVENILKPDIGNFLDKLIHIEIRTGDIYCYFETINDFLNGNRFKLENDLFYIAELDYYSENISTQNDLIKNYNKNIELIDFLTSISHSHSLVGDQLKLVIYRASSSIVEIDIKYSINDLESFSALEGITALKNELSDPTSHGDKKELFINDFVNFIENNSNDYLVIIRKWKAIISTYNKSYKIYIAGFSFEKIKSSSNEHFQKLLDRIYDSISKVSGYIFGIPVGFILLLNYFDYTGSLLFKNIVILLLSILFFVLIWFILLRNIKESIEAIEDDIDDFINLISTVAVLNPIKEKLENLKKVSIKKQRNKLLIVKGVTISIFVLTVLVYLFIFIDISVFLI